MKQSLEIFFKPLIIYLSFSLIALLSIGFSKVMATTETISVKEFATNSIQGLPNSADSLNTKLLSPMVGGGQMTTAGGSKFDAKIMCANSSSSFLEVFAQPGAAGDLSYLQFSRDTNLDGTIDNVSTFPKPTSGVCSNGIISCKAGTWEDCVGYKWNADNDNLTLIETGIGSLGGCYCINGSCGDPKRTGRIVSTIVGDIGSSAASTLASKNPKYTISNSLVTGPIAKFYGQKLEGCGKGDINKLASYGSNPANLESEANNLKTSTDGIYELISTSAAAKKNIVGIKSCNVKRNTITKNINLDDIISYNGGTGGIRNCSTPGCLELVLGRVGDNYWGGWCSVYNQKVSFYVDMPERIQKAKLVRAKYDDWIRVSANNQKIWAHPYSDWDGRSIGGRRCEWSTSWNQAPNIDFTSLLKQKGKVDFGIDVQVAGGGEGYAYAQVFVDESCKLEQEYITNQCESIQNDEKCTLKNEWIDGVQTYKNFHPTSKSPIATEKEIGGASCGLKVSRNWWDIKREYQCKTDIEFNFDKALERKNAISNSSTTNGYNDLVDGTTTKRTLSLPDIKTASCTNSCKTRRIKTGSTVTSDGTKSTTGNEFETLYRKCTGEEQNICPNEQEETVIKQCGCLNEFGEVSTMMNAMRYAAQDLMCTTGNPQEF
jgi:hypothetical protein